ncbi:DegT/DnrJ/EryC1/StrS family aminotransferase [Candidatus Thioglobus sp.]|nr:DegT/DnrJ/EryC1/StrS family aminotransferase [Candidatus Thioglobus sp.]
MNKSLKTIPYIDLKSQWIDERDELMPIIDKVMSSGKFILESECINFEESVAKLCDVNYAAAVNSGTDALMYALTLSGIKKGDEVITPSNSFIASTSSIVHVGATPVFVDVLPNQNLDPLKIENLITKNTKAIMPVHLTGRVCDMDPIIEIAKKYKLLIIEDAAQAIGSKYKGRASGSLGDIGCFSTHPLKNLNACGDGGFITTNNEDIYKKIKSFRNHGKINHDAVSHFGLVSRMDNLQAAILNYRLGKLDVLINKRQVNAKKYLEGINHKDIFIPEQELHEFNTYHTFVLQTSRRDELKEYLLNKGIKTAIHYPIPIHLQLASKSLGYKEGDLPVTEKQAKEILTLPVNQYLASSDLERIISAINSF